MCVYGLQWCVMKIERKSSGWKFHIFIHLASFYHFCLLLPLAYTWNRHQHPLCVYDFNLFDLRPVIVRLSFVSLHIDWNGYWNVCHRLFSLLSHQNSNKQRAKQRLSIDQCVNASAVVHSNQYTSWRCCRWVNHNYVLRCCVSRRKSINIHDGAEQIYDRYRYERFPFTDISIRVDKLWKKAWILYVALNDDRIVHFIKKPLVGFQSVQSIHLFYRALNHFHIMKVVSFNCNTYCTLNSTVT